MEKKQHFGDNFIARLQYYMEFKRLNDNQLTVMAGLSVGLLGKAKALNKSMNSTNIEKILLVCPDLDARWLLTGEGDMLSSPPAMYNTLSVVGSSVDNGATITNGATIANESQGEYSTRDAELAALRERVACLERMLADKERIIRLYEQLNAVK